MKILSKIKRRTNEDELPRRGEYVEMELYDTDRNPWPGPGGDSLWTRHDYDVAVPFNPPRDTSGDPSTALSAMLSDPLVIDRPSLAGMFVGGTFDVDNAGDTKLVYILLHLINELGQVVSVSRSGGYTSDGDYTDASFNFGEGGYTWLPLDPGSYTVRMWSYYAYSSGVAPLFTVTEMAATIILIPAGTRGETSGWDGTGV